MERKGLAPGKQVAYWEYDFAKDGGAIGVITMRGSGLPAGAIITNGMIHVVTAVTSGAATEVEIGLGAVDDSIRATTLKAAMTLNALLDVVPAGTAATAIRNTTAGAHLIMTIGAATITAGKIVVALEYL